VTSTPPSATARACTLRSSTNGVTPPSATHCAPGRSSTVPRRTTSARSSTRVNLTALVTVGVGAQSLTAIASDELALGRQLDAVGELDVGGGAGPHRDQPA